MRGPFNHPHRGETRDLRLTRRSHGSHVHHDPDHPRAQDYWPGVQFITNPYRESLETPTTHLQPATLDSGNELRPTSLDTMIGQEPLKPLLRRLVDNSKRSGRVMDHILLVGASGTGKTTLAMILARELGANCYVLKAPVDMATLEDLQSQAKDGDIVFVDEIHLQVQGDRRGVTQACDPESFYSLLEDRVLAAKYGPKPFPHVTWIGATTDVGLLPEALINRFPLQPRLAPYTYDEMAKMATANLKAINVTYERGVPELFALASRLNPRQLNSYVRAGVALDGSHIDSPTAKSVVCDLAGCTMDGLTPSMQTMLRYLYQFGGRKTREGVVYQASVNALATACGHGRDTKAINVLVEPWLIQAGLILIRPQGRALTDKGITRAKELA